MIDRVSEDARILITYENGNSMPAGSRAKETDGIRILFEDDWIIVADKPAGLLTHPSFLGETHALTTLLSDYTLHPISRLDRDTSGLILLGKNAYAHDQLTRQDMKKTYTGIIHGGLPSKQGVIDAPIARCEDSIIRRQVNHNGQLARTHYEVFAGGEFQGSAFQCVRFQLETGRTHQIRVHCLHTGCPLIGDTLYSNSIMDLADTVMGRQALHASKLLFLHPLTKDPLVYESPLRPDIQAFLDRADSLVTLA